MVTEDERLTYTVERAAELLGISYLHARHCVQDGSLPVVRFGHRQVVSKAALNKLLSGEKIAVK